MKKKTKVITTAVSAVLLSLLAVYGSHTAGSLDSQNMAERWQADELKFSQISVFYPNGSGSYKEDETVNISSFISDKLKSESFSSGEDTKIWTDAYSSAAAQSDVSVYDIETGRTQSSSKVSVIGTGGSFFEFHQLQLISGNYIYDNELRTDRAVLDENAAWNIFSSTDVTGMKFMINNCEFEVAGVVRHEDNSAVDAVYPEDPLIYVHYAALKEAELDDSLLCYEAVIPNPVTNFARNTVLEFFGINTMTERTDDRDPEKSLPVVITENTGRYSLPKLLSGLKTFDRRFISDRSIAYPYWENAARVTDVRLSGVLFISLLLAAYIFITAVIFVCRLYLNRKWHLKDFIEDLMYKYTYKKRSSDYIISDITESEEGKESRFDQQ